MTGCYGLVRSSELETFVQGLIGGIVAVVVGLVLAGLTTFGVVNTVSSAPSQPDQSVMDYGTNQQAAE